MKCVIVYIDPGGYTATNFNKSNESPFFLPEINRSNDAIPNLQMPTSTANLAFQRQGYTAKHQDYGLRREVQGTDLDRIRVWREFRGALTL